MVMRVARSVKQMLRHSPSEGLQLRLLFTSPSEAERPELTCADLMTSPLLHKQTSWSKYFWSYTWSFETDLRLNDNSWLVHSLPEADASTCVLQSHACTLTCVSLSPIKCYKTCSKYNYLLICVWQKASHYTRLEWQYRIDNGFCH